MSKVVLSRHHVTSQGAGQPVVVLAHGFGCDQRMWRFVAPDLARDHRVVLFDYVGCGRSDMSAWSPERYASLDDQARDVLEILDALDAGPVVFVGHSISGSIGLLAAIARPERFTRLIMVGPNPCFINHPPDYMGGFDRQDVMELLELMERNMIGWANFFAPVAMKNEGRPELSAELLQSLCNGDPVIVRHFARQVFLSDVREHLPMLKVPASILQCADDAVAPLTIGQYLNERLAGSTLINMKATGHCPHMSHPEETIALIREELARRVPAESWSRA
jgi:sigma-B regulation protein RsbQ